MGTLDYLAPELIKGEQASPATDIYALGCTVYECVAGQPPFADKEGIQVGLAHVAEPPPELSRFRDDIPPAFAERAAELPLAKDPAERPADGGRVRSAPGRRALAVSQARSRRQQLRRPGAHGGCQAGPGVHFDHDPSAGERAGRLCGGCGSADPSGLSEPRVRSGARVLIPGDHTRATGENRDRNGALHVERRPWCWEQSLPDTG